MLKRQIRLTYICIVSKILLLHSDGAFEVFPKAFLSIKYTKCYKPPASGSDFSAMWWIIFYSKEIFSVFFFFSNLFHKQEKKK